MKALERIVLSKDRWLLWSLLAVGLAVLAAPLQAQPQRAQFLYVTNAGSNNVSAYMLFGDLMPELMPVDGSPFRTGKKPSSAAAVAAVGILGFVYVTNSGDDTVSAYTINQSTGALTEVRQADGSPFRTGKNPSSVAAERDGLFLYVTNADSDTLLLYRINAVSGALTAVEGYPLSDAAVPSSVTTTVVGGVR